jgi:OPT family oligopeptide transporter
MKIPPRKLFTVQMYGTIVGVLINYVVIEWIIALKFGVLRGEEVDASGQWEARNSRVFYAAALIWGAFGPSRVFGEDSPYASMLWFFLIGALLPIPFYLLYKKFPNGIWHLINVPILATGATQIPQSPANFIVSGFLVGFIFQYYVYRSKRPWWNRFNYVLSAALDSGTQISAILIFVTVGQTKWGNFIFWPGNPDPSLYDVDYCNVTLALGGPHMS